MTNDKVVDYTDCRDALFNEIFELAKIDKNVILLSGDTGAFIFTQFKKELPNQFFNLGINEQNMMSVAAGLAKMGKKPFIYGISNFVTIRCLEQIRIDVCGMNLPVTILGTGTGLIYSSDGLTHHITEDVSVMRAMPNMRIFSPSDHNMLGSLVHTAYKHNGPCYIRFDKGPFERKYDFKTDGIEVPYSVFLAIQPKALYIIATGVTVDIALKVKALLQDSIGVIDITRLKPVDIKTLPIFLKEHATHIITLEEHTTTGGLGTIIQELMTEYKINVFIKVMGIPDKFVYEVGDRDYLRKFYGLDSETVLQYILEIL